MTIANAAIIVTCKLFISANIKFARIKPPAKNGKIHRRSKEGNAAPVDVRIGNAAIGVDPDFGVPGQLRLCMLGLSILCCRFAYCDHVNQYADACFRDQVCNRVADLHTHGDICAAEIGVGDHVYDWIEAP
jgi:hypothetical protein